MNPLQQQFIKILKICCFFLFLGRGWQHLFWDIPIRSLLWDEELLSGIVQPLLNMTWQEYVSDPKIENFISIAQKLMGIFYISLALLSLYLKPLHKRLGRLLIVGSTFLLLLVLLYYKEKFYYLGMLIEHALQVGTPLILYVALFKKDFFVKYIFYFKVLIAMTFIGHGLFAVGFHPVPGPFIDMIINVLGFSEDSAVLMLRLAGSLDFVASIALFIPVVEIYALLFTAFWGTVTAFARVLANINGDLIEFTSHQWVMETLYRVPHGLVPFAIFYYLKKSKS